MHLTITTSEFKADIGVSGTTEGVDAEADFCGVGSSIRTTSEGFGSGSGFDPVRRCFLEGI